MRRTIFLGLAVLLAAGLMFSAASVSAVDVPAACSGACTTPGAQCCWTEASGAYQNTCLGDDYCTGGCTMGPAVYCGAGGECTGQQGVIGGGGCTFGGPFATADKLFEVMSYPVFVRDALWR